MTSRGSSLNWYSQRSGKTGIFFWVSISMKWISKENVPGSLIFSHWILSEMKKSFAIFHSIFGNFPILQKNCLLLFSKFFRKDAKSTRYFMYNEGELCLIWTIHLSSTLLCSHNRKFGKTTRDLPYDKIHRLDTSIINKISQMRKQQICKNKRIGTNWTIGC